MIEGIDYFHFTSVFTHKSAHFFFVCNVPEVSLYSNFSFFGPSFFLINLLGPVVFFILEFICSEYNKFCLLYGASDGRMSKD